MPKKQPTFRLPQHLAATSARAPRKDTPESGQDRPNAGGSNPARPSSPKKATQAPEAQDRIGQLLPVVLRAMVGAYADGTLPAHAPPIVLDRAQILGALAPYYRPKSRFEQLVVRRLVGEHYLQPRGGLEKQGLSGAYTLTPKGERLVGIERRR